MLTQLLWLAEMFGWKKAWRILRKGGLYRITMNEYEMVRKMQEAFERFAFIEEEDRLTYCVRPRSPDLPDVNVSGPYTKRSYADCRGLTATARVQEAYQATLEGFESKTFGAKDRTTLAIPYFTDFIGEVQFGRIRMAVVEVLPIAEIDARENVPELIDLLIYIFQNPAALPYVINLGGAGYQFTQQRIILDQRTDPAMVDQVFLHRLIHGQVGARYLFTVE